MWLRIAVGYNNINYEYDANGIRISKTVVTDVTKYIVDGSTVMRQKWNVGTNNYIADYFYDESGAPLGFAYSVNGGAYQYYFYETNLQGDITAIYNSDIARIVSFNYNAWGEIVYTAKLVVSTATDAFMKASLFRYRGYIYDSDTGLYYLQSRYYDPQTGRFINADDVDYLGIGDNAVLSYNLYAYCGNNPVNGYDPEGNINWQTVFGVGIAVAVIGIVSVVAAPVLATAIAVTASSIASFGTQIAIVGIATAGVAVTFDLVENESSLFYEAKAGDGIAEHKNGSKNWDKHSKPRAGGKEKKDGKMNPRIDKKKRNAPKGKKGKTSKKIEKACLHIWRNPL